MILLKCSTQDLDLSARFLLFVSVPQFISEFSKPTTLPVWYTVGSPQMYAETNSTELNDGNDNLRKPKFLRQAGRDLPQAGFQFFYVAKLHITGFQ